MSSIASQIPASRVFSTVYSSTDQWKYQSSASLAFVRGIHRWPVNPPHKRPVTWKMFPFDDVIMKKHEIYLCFVSFLQIWLKYFLIEVKDPHTLPCQYPCWPDDAENRGISGKDIDLVPRNIHGTASQNVNPFSPVTSVGGGGAFLRW